MVKARDSAAWNRTFAVLAQLYNVNRQAGAEAIDPLQFFPWSDRSRPAKAPTPAEERMLERLFPAT